MPWWCASWAAIAIALACGGEAREGHATGLVTGIEPSEDTGTSTGDVPIEPSSFGPEQAFVLRLDDAPPVPLQVELTRDQVTELMGDRAGEVLLLEVDSTVLLTETLERLKFACGGDWQRDAVDPHHDCSLTDIGQDFGGPGGDWRSSPEYALIRVLTTTPANASVVGTSSASLAGLADTFGVGGGFSEILAGVLGIPRTREIVSTPSLVRAFQDAFVGSHPAVGENGTLAIYLSDALSDLATLSARLGPAGDHPGILDPAFPLHGEMLGPDFRLVAVGHSNLRLVDGFDGELGKGYLSVLDDRIGPTYEDEIEVDFHDPDAFRFEGLVSDLRVDLRLRIQEADPFVWSCTGDLLCQDNLPGEPASAQSVWAFQPYELEYAVALAAYEEYRERRFAVEYLLGLATIAVGQGSNPAGWLQYWVPLDLGNPPEDQYLWETILEVAQVNLHHTPYGDFDEGEADVAFTIHDLPIGLTGEQAAEAVRPYLQAQAAALSDVLFGDFRKHNDPVDVYYRRGDDGRPYLYFVAPEDLDVDEPYDYARPGFFAGPTLDDDDKISARELPGTSDHVHEKLAITPGEHVLYYADEHGQRYRLRVELGDDDALQVGLAAALD